jgi:hypothetical protein
MTLARSGGSELQSFESGLFRVLRRDEARSLFWRFLSVRLAKTHPWSAAVLVDELDKSKPQLETAQALRGAEGQLIVAIQNFVDAQAKVGKSKGTRSTSCVSFCGRRARKKQSGIARLSKSSGDSDVRGTPTQDPSYCVTFTPGRRFMAASVF